MTAARKKTARKSAEKTDARTRSADDTALRDRVLLAALPDVPFDGWGDSLLDRAAAKTDLSRGEIGRLFPAGATDLAAHLSGWADRKMEEKLLTLSLADLRVRDRIALGVRTRLEILAPYKAAVQAALGASVDPRRARMLPRRLWQSADRMWWLAGDTATDYNHYTKRLLLSGVIASTTLYWLSDTSHGHTDSWQFLDRRIDEVLKLGRGIGALRERLPAVTLPSFSLADLRRRYCPRRRKDA